MKNREVVEKFMRREKARTKNLVSDGKTLYSYGYYPLATWVGEKCLLITKEPYESQTTKKHYNAVLAWSVNGVRLFVGQKQLESVVAGSSFELWNNEFPDTPIDALRLFLSLVKRDFGWQKAKKLEKELEPKLKEWSVLKEM